MTDQYMTVCPKCSEEFHSMFDRLFIEKHHTCIDCAYIQHNDDVVIAMAETVLKELEVE